MGSESTTQPNLTNESVKKVEEDEQHTKGEFLKENIENPVYVNTIPMREDQVQNAVKFLSHPKVRGSPVIYRRSFLEKKGLTKEEIDEAFRRVPDSPANVVTAPTTSSTQDGQLQSSSVSQPQPAPRTLKPSTVSPSGSTSVISKVSHFHWSHAILAVGILAASGAGTGFLFKTAVVPRLKAWIRKVVSEDDDSGKLENSRPNAIEEAVAAAKAAAAAAADVAKASQEILTSRNEERKYFELLTQLLDTQVGEMKSMQNALHKMDGRIDIHLAANKQTEEKLQTEPSSALKPIASVEPVAAPPHPKSYMDIMAMIQRGEKLPNIQEINDNPPNPNQPLPNPRILPRPKPWEVNQTRTTYEAKSVSGLEPQANGSSLLNGGRFAGSDNSEPWWQRKTVKITEIEPEREWTPTFNEVPIDDGPAHRGWVPPPPPPLSMPEAAAAIRQPKSLIPKEQMTGEQLMYSGIRGETEKSGAHSSAVVSELEEVGIEELKKADAETSHMVSGGSSSYSTEIEESLADVN